VNLIGLALFSSHAHGLSHGGGGGHSHSNNKKHKHDHEDGSHGHGHSHGTTAAVEMNGPTENHHCELCLSSFI